MTDETQAAKIDDETLEANAGEKPKTTRKKAVPKTFPVKINRGYFPEDGGSKLPRGTECELPVDEALAVIEAGIAERNDKLPKA